jgi:hypothetical protein
MNEALRKSKPLTALLAQLLACEVPEPMRRKLAGLRADGARKKGRPKKGTIELSPKATFGDAIVLSLVCRALSGDVFASKLIWNCIEGLPQRSILFQGNIAAQPMGIDELRAKLLALAGEGAHLLEVEKKNEHTAAENPESAG